MNIKRILKILSLAALIVILMIAIAGYFFIKKFNLDDGPFYGESREFCDLNEPNSILNMENGFRLESFPREENERSATVRLIKNNKIEWCIYAHGYDHTYVHSIEFGSHAKESYDKTTIYASVHWTYGREAATWNIDNDGDLIEYWYSW